MPAPVPSVNTSSSPATGDDAVALHLGVVQKAHGLLQNLRQCLGQRIVPPDPISEMGCGHDIPIGHCAGKPDRDAVVILDRVQHPRQSLQHRLRRTGIGRFNPDFINKHRPRPIQNRGLEVRSADINRERAQRVRCIPISHFSFPFEVSADPAIASGARLACRSAAPLLSAPCCPRHNREMQAFPPPRHPACVFRSMRPRIPTTCAHLFRSIRPSVTRCHEAVEFGYQV